MNQAADCAITRYDGSECAGNIATALAGSNDASPGFGNVAMGSTSFDSVAVWVNEAGAGGEVIR